MLNISKTIVTHILIAAGLPQHNFGGVRIFSYFIIALGLLSVIYPRLFWHLRVGRKLPGVPPNRLYLLVLRFGGLLVILLGFYVIHYINQMI